MDQLSTQIMALILVIAALGVVVVVAVVLYQRVGKSRVDHSVEQSASGIVIEDQEDINKKIFLEDKIQPVTPVTPKNDKLLKFN
jgi:archaellin